MIQVHFEDIHKRIIEQISNARNVLKICVAWFTDVDIYRAILEIQKKGVFVYVIIANHEFNKKSKVDFKELLQNNGCVGYIGNLNDTSSDKLMHNKFCIIDSNVVITGSYNWTFKARLNDENVIIIKNQPNVTAKFTEKFESIKPQFGFTIKGNTIKLLPIDSIMAKWDRPIKLISKISQSKTKSILDKI